MLIRTWCFSSFLLLRMDVGKVLNGIEGSALHHLFQFSVCNAKVLENFNSWFVYGTLNS